MVTGISIITTETNISQMVSWQQMYWLNIAYENQQFKRQIWTTIR